MIVVRPVAFGRLWSVVSGAPCVVESLREFSGRHALRQVVRAGIDIVNSPVATGTRGCIGILDDQREALRFVRRIFPPQRRRQVLALLRISLRHGLAISKRAAAESECHRSLVWIVTLQPRAWSPVARCDVCRGY